MADGAEKNLQEKFRSHQLVLMLTGDFLFNKDLQLNFYIWYFIWWTASPTPPAGSISAARLARMQPGETNVLTHSAQPRPPNTGLSSDGHWEKTKMVKNSSACTWYVQRHKWVWVCEFRSTNSTNVSIWVETPFRLVIYSSCSRTLEVHGVSCGQRGKQKGKKGKKNK